MTTILYLSVCYTVHNCYSI